MQELSENLGKRHAEIVAQEQCQLFAGAGYGEVTESKPRSKIDDNSRCDFRP